MLSTPIRCTDQGLTRQCFIFQRKDLPNLSIRLDTYRALTPTALKKFWVRPICTHRISFNQKIATPLLRDVITDDATSCFYSISLCSRSQIEDHCPEYDLSSADENHQRRLPSHHLGSTTLSREN